MTVDGTSLTGVKNDTIIHKTENIQVTDTAAQKKGNLKSQWLKTSHVRDAIEPRWTVFQQAGINKPVKQFDKMLHDKKS